MPLALHTMLDALRADFENQASPEQLQEFHSVIGALDGAPAFGLQPGDTAADFSLPSGTGATVSLRELLAKGPVVLQFFGSGRDPYNNIHLRALDRIYADILSLGADIVGISAEDHDELARNAETTGIRYPLLHDENHAIAQKYGTVFRVNDGTEIALPATFVVGKDGVIFSAFRNADFTKRKEPVEVYDELRVLVDDGKRKLDPLSDRLDIESVVRSSG
jgi:peroxiredoxin